jgi:hypothetical protein
MIILRKNDIIRSTLPLHFVRFSEHRGEHMTRHAGSFSCKVRYPDHVLRWTLTLLHSLGQSIIVLRNRRWPRWLSKKGNINYPVLVVATLSLALDVNAAVISWTDSEF